MWFIGFLAVIFVLYLLVKRGKNKQSVQAPPTKRSPLPGDVDFPVEIVGVTTGNSRLTWVGAGEELVVSRYRIKEPLTYTSKGTPSTPEASCVDVTLKVGVPVAEPKGALGYWPEYSKISPDQRANYLTWLATGRKAHLHDIGYAFIFFYGLERRLLIDKQDAQPIVIETLRLLETYTESNSFRGYLTSFLAYTVASTGLQKLSESWHRRIFEEKLARYSEDVLAVALAWLYMHQKPLTPGLAFRISQNDPRSPKSVVLKRLPEEFQALYSKKFEARFAHNFILKAAKSNRALSHHPASPSLLGRSNAISSIPIPDVFGIQSQFKPLIDIWTECISELKPTSLKVAKGLDLSSREAYEALPPELKAQYDHPDKPEWQRIIAKQGRDDGIAIVPVFQLALMRAIEERPKLTMKQSLDIANGARDAGFLLNPDPWTIQRPYLWKELVAVVPSDGEEDPESDNFFHAAALMLELGVGMAAADGKIERDEVVHVSLVLRNQFRLSQTQARRLEAFREILIRIPPALNGIGKRIQKILSPEQREFIGYFLIGVAASDGQVTKSERTALKSVYRSMGLSPDKLDALLAKLTAKAEAPVIIQPAVPTKPGEAIPPREPVVDEQTVVLDMELVAQISRETMAVADMIGKAMGELDESTVDVENEIESALVSITPPPVLQPSQISTLVGTPGDGKYDGLAQRYHAALDELLTRETWSKVDFDRLARKHGLMPSGMMEEINSWSDERLGDYIIEGKEPYYVQREILEGKP